MQIIMSLPGSFIWKTVFFFAVVISRQTVHTSCIHKENVTRMWRKIETPAFPSPFPPSTKCTWSLTSPSTYRIKIQFTQFSLLRPNAQGICKFQWLSVMNGVSISAGEENGYKLCGKRSPGTLITTGRYLQIYLHSTVAASGQEYSGFQASLTTTQEQPLLPGLNVEQIMQNELNARKQKKPARRRETLGSVLNKIRPQSRPVVLTQSQRIEEMNRRRNLGIPVRENPVYDANGNVIGGFLSTKRSRATTTRTTVAQNVPSKKRGPTLSNEIKTVLIVVGIISACFVLLLILKKCGFLRRVSDWSKSSEDEESSIDEINETKASRHISDIVRKESEKRQKQSPPQIIQKSDNNFKDKDKALCVTRLGKDNYKQHSRPQPAQKASAVKRMKRTISKKAGVRRTPHRHAEYREQMKNEKMKSNQRIIERESSKNDAEKLHGSARNIRPHPTYVTSNKRTVNSGNKTSKSSCRQSERKSTKTNSTALKYGRDATKERSYRTQAYKKSDRESTSSTSKSLPNRAPRKPVSKSNRSKQRHKQRPNRTRKNVKKFTSSESSESSESSDSSTTSENSTSSESSFERRRRPR